MKRETSGGTFIEHGVVDARAQDELSTPLPVVCSSQVVLDVYPN